jgi:hypothetical protein
MYAKTPLRYAIIQSVSRRRTECLWAALVIARGQLKEDRSSAMKGLKIRLGEQKLLGNSLKNLLFAGNREEFFLVIRGSRFCSAQPVYSRLTTYSN